MWRCWFFHKWTKWESVKLLKSYEQGEYKNSLPVEQHLIQARACERCGKKKYRREFIL